MRRKELPTCSAAIMTKRLVIAPGLSALRELAATPARRTKKVAWHLSARFVAGESESRYSDNQTLRIKSMGAAAGCDSRSTPTSVLGLGYNQVHRLPASGRTTETDHSLRSSRFHNRTTCGVRRSKIPLYLRVLVQRIKLLAHSGLEVSLP